MGALRLKICRNQSTTFLKRENRFTKNFLENYDMNTSTLEKELERESFVDAGTSGDEKNSARDEQENPRVILPFKEEKEYFFPEAKVKKKPVYAAVKRLFDIIFCLTALILLSPAFILIAVIVKCSSKGPVFYVQKRLGYKGKTIRVPKFRTMYSDAEQYGAQWSEGDDDPRIYPFGRFLRKTRLDELPQLWCCVIGTMSLVGPRPERECFAKEFEKYIHGFSERLKAKPGITGWAQVNGGYDLRPEEKIVYDIEYIEKCSLWMDIKIVFKTVTVLFNHKGAK